jgi:hypothetical protein
VRALPLVALAVFCLSSSASAQSAPGAGVTPRLGAQHNGYYGRLVSNRNGCAPGYAHAVWGPNSALLGYRCSSFLWR